MAYSEIIDDILDKVFLEIFGNSRKNPPPWFNRFVDWPDIKKVENNETDNVHMYNCCFNNYKRKT